MSENSDAPIGLIFGHSHIWSINRALHAEEFSPNTAVWRPKVVLCGTQKLPGTLVCYSSGGTENLNPALMAALSDYPPSKCVAYLVSGVQGNYYNIVGLLDEGGPFDFILPSEPDLPLDLAAQLIPIDCVVEILRAQMHELDPYLRRLTRLGYRKVLHLAPPQPHPSNEKLAELLKADLSAVAPNALITNKWVRLKLWKLQQQLVKEICDRHSVVFVAAPASTADPEGFLLEALCKDSVHGTSAFASALLKEVEVTLESLVWKEVA